MKLYLIRHAEAIARSDKIAEENRYLTVRGRKSFRLTARRMAKKGKMPGLIVTSPLARALQTAEILSEALGFKGEVAISPELAPGFDQAKLRRILASFKGKRSLVLVGHEPDLGQVAGTLLGLTRPLTLKKGMVACLNIIPAKQGAKASLKWLLFEGKKIDASAMKLERARDKSKRPKK